MAEIESQLVSEKRLRGLKIQIIEVSEKDDFKQIPDLTVLHPRDIKIQD